MKTKYNQQKSIFLFVQHYSMLWLLLFCISTATIYAQSPQKLAYQSVVRDASGNLLTNTTVGIQISILQGSLIGISVYSETYSPTPETDINGLVNLEIGGGTPSIGVFTDIDWSSDSYFLRVDIDPLGGTSYTITGTSQLLSVPYALYAETSGNVNTHDGWSLSGNADTNPTNNFIGTTDNQALKFRIENEPFGELNRATNSVFFGEQAGLNSAGIDNIGIGKQALMDNTAGFNNIGLGSSVLLNNAGAYNIGIGSFTLRDNTTGNRNIGMGHLALRDNTTGSDNIGMGLNALQENTIGSDNIGMGHQALLSNTRGSNNIGLGDQTLTTNTTGHDNIGMGNQALTANTTGDDNIGMGNQVLKNNTRGSFNIAIGLKSLSNNELGLRNIAIGFLSLSNNRLGQDNIAIGTNSLHQNEANHNLAVGNYALYLNTVGTYNIAIGAHALISNSSGNYNTAIGSSYVMHNVTSGQYNTALGNNAMASVTTSLNNTAIGTGAMPNATGFNNTAIGHEAEVGNPAASHQVRIGNSQITSATIQVPWTSPSDKKWKEQIRSLPYGLDLVSQLKPVDYIRKNNESKTRETGFIAQDVEKLLTKVGYSEQGFLSKDSKGGLSLRYNDFIPLLTKAIQELNNSNKSLQKMNIELIKRIEKLEQQN